MLTRIQYHVISQLWNIYQSQLADITTITTKLLEQYQEELIRDHLAIIDLPGPHSGIETLSRLFSYLDYSVRGSGYLTDKQNNFTWLAENSTASQLAIDALPQIVVADFRREALAPEVLKIVAYYASFAKPLDDKRLASLHQRVLQQDQAAADEMTTLIMDYLQGRDWPLPTVGEFQIVKSHNELLAWVLVMGRQVNHFAWSIHLSKAFSNLAAFNNFVLSLQIPLNGKEGLIKGNEQQGIAQSATQAPTRLVKLADGFVELSDRFVEFVWRYPQQKGKKTEQWQDYFTGFVADNADHVVESLFLAEQ